MSQKSSLPQVTRFVSQALMPDIRMDHGPELIRGTLLSWAEKRVLAIQHVQPGKPQPNAYIERCNRTVRHEWLGQYLFRTIEEVKDSATEWLWTYNNERPDMALGGITPAQKLRRQTEV
jgi:putative transposase